MSEGSKKKTKNYYMLKIFGFIVVLIFGIPKKIEKFIKGGSY